MQYFFYISRPQKIAYTVHAVSEPSFMCTFLEGIYGRKIMDSFITIKQDSCSEIFTNNGREFIVESGGR